MSRVVVVAPLREGARDEARLLIEAGPPFDPARAGLTLHDVYLTDQEAVFVFQGSDAKAAIEALLGDPGVVRAAAAWRDCLAGRPRLAEHAFSWGDAAGETA